MKKRSLFAPITESGEVEIDVKSIPICMTFDYSKQPFSLAYQGRRGRDRIVIGYKTTYAISAYHH